jgi:hypothetical protein
VERRNVPIYAYALGISLVTIVFYLSRSYRDFYNGRPDADYELLVTTLGSPWLSLFNFTVGVGPFLLVRRMAPVGGAKRFTFVVLSLVIVSFFCFLVFWTITRPTSYSAYFYAPPPPLQTYLFKALADDWVLLFLSGVGGGLVCGAIDLLKRRGKNATKTPPEVI